MTRWSTNVTVFLIQVVLSAGVASATIQSAELEALDQIYNVLQGDHWIRNAGWRIPGIDPCSAPDAWAGVRCTEDGTHVAALHLLTNRLAGDLGALTKLRNLSQLGQLELGNDPSLPADQWNHLSGSLPPGFESLTSLYYIDLRFNGITDVLDPFASFTGLQHLALEENHFFGPIPPGIGALTELTELTLNGNQITGPIPPQLGQLTKLGKLWLYNNALGGTVPAELGNLLLLTELRLGGNAFTGPIPPGLGNLQSLRNLELGLAFLDGELPPELANLAQLRILSLGTNRLSGDLGHLDWSRLTQLEEVYLDTNLFSGPLPESLAALPHLRILRLRANGLRGDVPSSYLDLLGRAAEMDLRWNAFDPPADATQVLDSQSGGQFSATQTVAPRAIAVARRAAASFFVSWKPIQFLLGEGGYRIDVFQDPAAGASPIREVFVAGKEASSALVGDVPAVPTIFVRITTLTDPHPFNPGHVESDASEAVPVDGAGGSGIARFERDRYVVREGDVLSLRALRLDGAAGSLQALVSARPGTATPADYSAPQPASLLWPASDATVKSVTLATVADSLLEPTETMQLVLTVGSDTAQATVEIGDRVVAGTASDPVIATNAQGLSFAAWMQPQANSSFRDIFGRFLDSAGRAVSGVIEIAADRALDEHDPEVVALDDNSFVVAWIQDRQDDSGKQMGNCRPTAEEAKCKATVRSGPGLDVEGIALAADGRSFWLGWTTRDGFFVLPGSGFGSGQPPIQVSAPPPGSSQLFAQPRLVRLRANRFLAVWNSVPAIKDAIEVGGEVQAQAFSPVGLVAGDLLRFGGSAAASQRRPRAVRVSDSAAFIAWEETGKASTEGVPQVAWSAIADNDHRQPQVARILPAGRALGKLEVVRQAGGCQIVWLSLSPASELFERWVVPACSSTAVPQGRPSLVVDLGEGARESFAVTSIGGGALLLVEELVAARGIRWLKTARPPNL